MSLVELLVLLGVLWMGQAAITRWWLGMGAGAPVVMSSARDQASNGLLLPVLVFAMAAVALPRFTVNFSYGALLDDLGFSTALLDHIYSWSPLLGVAIAGGLLLLLSRNGVASTAGMMLIGMLGVLVGGAGLSVSTTFMPLFAAQSIVFAGSLIVGAAAASELAGRIAPYGLPVQLAWLSLGTSAALLFWNALGGAYVNEFGRQTVSQWTLAPLLLAAPALGIAGLRGLRRSSGRDPNRVPKVAYQVLLAMFLHAGAAAGGGFWFGSFLIRSFGSSLDELQSVQTAIAVAGAAGVIGGGYLSRWLAQDDVAWLMRVPALSAVVLALLCAAAYQSDSLAAAVALGVAAGIAAGVWTAPVYATLLVVLPVNRRPLMYALAGGVVSIGVSQGNDLVGMMSDLLGLGGLSLAVPASVGIFGVLAAMVSSSVARELPGELGRA